MKTKLLIIILGLLIPTIILNAQWQKLNNGLSNYLPYRLNIDSDNPENVLVSLGAFLYLSTNSGDSWKNLPIPLETSISSLFMNNNIIFFGRYKGFFISTDLGCTWSEKDTILDHNIKRNMYEVNCINYFKNKIYVGSSFPIKTSYKSTDYGNSWIKMSPEVLILDGDVVKCSSVKTIAMLDSMIILGTSGSIIYSKDDGITWKVMKKYMADASILEVINKKVYASSYSISSVFEWTGIDLKWNTFATFAEPDKSIYGIMGIKGCGDNIYVGRTDSGIYVTPDYGKTWKCINYNLQGIIEPAISSANYPFLSFAINEKYIFAGTYYGLYRAPLKDCMLDTTGTAVEESEPPPASEFSIAPSPAADYIEITGINHTLKSVVDEQPEIRIYNIYGELVLSAKSNGTPNQRIDVSGLAAGVYFVRAGNNFAKFVKVK